MGKSILVAERFDLPKPRSIFLTHCKKKILSNSVEDIAREDKILPNTVNCLECRMASPSSRHKEDYNIWGVIVELE